MECLIKLLTACIFDPSQVYITAEVQTVVRQAQYENVSWCEDRKRWCNGDIPVTFKLGVEARLSQAWTLNYGAMHRSMADTKNDQGIEGFFISATWRPFK